MSSAADATQLFQGGGELSTRMRAVDWAATPLGPLEGWPQSLRSAIGICLGSRFPIAIYWGPTLSLLYNDAWSPIPGTKHPWALGQAARDVWPEIWDAIGPMFEQVMTTGESTYSEDALLPMHRHGYTEECYFNFTFTPIRGEGGRIEGVFNAVIETTFRVISERRTRALRELSDRIASARSADGACELAAAALGANVHDVPFCAIYLVGGTDGGSARLAGTSRLAVGTAAAPAAIDLGVDEAVWPLARVRDSGRVEVVEHLAERFGATPPRGAWPEPVHAALVAPLLSGGRLLGFLVLGANPRRSIDEEYRQFAERAASLIANAVGNADAYEAERRRAEALAEVDRAKTAFFSNVSHEFRTPLTLMLGPQEDALSLGGGVLAGEDLRAVHRNTLRLLKLVNSLLDFSRIEAGRARATFVPTDLAALTRDLASAFRSAIERGGVAFQVDCPPLPEATFVDRDMWEKIVLNLLSNAFKFTFEGSIAISLRAAEGRVELRVADTGVGISASELPRVFERFHRIESARARTHEGSGIGLALVHSLVASHGGAVDVTSREGEGTTFIVSIPQGSAHLPAEHLGDATQARAHAHAHAEAYVAEALRWVPEADDISSPGLIATPGAASAHVVVADDNADMREYLTRLLRPHATVEAVSNGALALAAARARRPDLVLTDVMMPELDGFGLLRALRAEPRTADVPVIMLSARAGDEARVEGLQAGADDYLVKPFSARELLARVNTHVQLARLRAGAEVERNKLHALFEQAPVAIAIFEGLEHRIAVFNARSREILGPGRRPPRAGEPLAEFLPELKGTAIIGLLDEVVRTGEPRTATEHPISLRRADGALEPRVFNTFFHPVRGLDGEVTGVMIASYESTEEVRLREAARAASRAKDEFMAMLGHELRNPLAPIQTSLRLMRTHGRDAPEQAVIERQVTHLVRLVDDLLDISRITRGLIDLRRERLELAAVVDQGLEMASPMLEQRRQTVNVSVAASGLAVDGDHGRLAQVVSNLLTNASKYSDPGTTIHVAAEAIEGGWVRLRVRDEGVGIDSQMLEKIFDLFVQQQQSLDRSKGGLGLGLAIVRSLVELHGGRVRAESKGLGHGSEFVLDLPPAMGAVASSGAAAPARPAHAAAPAKVRALIVDDNQDAAETLAEVLTDLGYAVATAHDGAAALKIATAFRPTVCLLDIGLPTMDGYELARRLRASAALPEGARLIAVTGYGQDNDRRLSSEAGFDTHLVKPVDLDALIDLVQG
jgi:signal transduction histidine kinase/DNA-binding response OmpR family regulator